ncbi:MAG: type II toxin-antitoxin system HicA family toxin [Nitrospinae bacterium]|nr:type II toxin-antitoxin system HicA family toxin [Nitrospinota bacterium]
MPRITPVQWQRLIKVFRAAGFSESRMEGSHTIMTKPGAPRPVVIPHYASVGRDIIISNMKTAGLSRDEYLRLLEKA